MNNQDGGKKKKKSVKRKPKGSSKRKKSSSILKALQKMAPKGMGLSTPHAQMGDYLKLYKDYEPMDKTGTRYISEEYPFLQKPSSIKSSQYPDLLMPGVDWKSRVSSEQEEILSRLAKKTQDLLNANQGVATGYEKFIPLEEEEMLKKGGGPFDFSNLMLPTGFGQQQQARKVEPYGVDLNDDANKKFQDLPKSMYIQLHDPKGINHDNLIVKGTMQQPPQQQNPLQGLDFSGLFM
jgi:hypothetical protein